MLKKLQPAYAMAALALILLVSGSVFGAMEPDLRIYGTTVAFRHFAFQLKPDRTMLSFDRHKIVETVFAAKVIENKYLKVTLLPEYGGRILSLIYKPTGHEELYQNPVGTPYGIGEGNFYYNWLMVYGGIFPTFPEPEHGKTWCLPWKTRIVAQTPDEIGVEMSFVDDITPVPGVPAKFNKGRTNLICTTTVWVYKDSPYLKLHVKLQNPQDKPVDYEYWTCTTLAPGSQPGKTLSPGESEIIAPIGRVKSKDDWWRWMGSVDKPIDATRHIFEFKNLATFANWADMGIAYAYPKVEGSFWGVVNHVNEEGLFRVADNPNVTPGLKLWTWGYKQSYATDPGSFGNAARPYIELWAGHSPEFFVNASLAAHEVKDWDEYYIPTVGLPKVTFANVHALVYLDYAMDEEKAHVFHAKVFTTHPGETMDLLLRIKGDSQPELYHKSFTGTADQSLELDLGQAAGSLAAGKYAFEMVLKSSSGAVLAQTSIPYEVE